jgi:hypothetical protein
MLQRKVRNKGVNGVQPRHPFLFYGFFQNSQTWWEPFGTIGTIFSSFGIGIWGHSWGSNTKDPRCPKGKE